MTPSKKAKQLGCKSMKQVAEMSGVHRGVLQRWFNNRPFVFTAVCREVAIQTAVEDGERVRVIAERV